jgi:hypothetical protein
MTNLNAFDGVLQAKRDDRLSALHLRLTKAETEGTALPATSIKYQKEWGNKYDLRIYDLLLTYEALDDSAKLALVPSVSDQTKAEADLAKAR